MILIKSIVDISRAEKNNDRAIERVEIFWENKLSIFSV